MIKKMWLYLKEVQQEMAKVTWPNREEIIGGTTLVVALSLIVAVVVKVFDLGLSKVLGFILNQ